MTINNARVLTMFVLLCSLYHFSSGIQFFQQNEQSIQLNADTLFTLFDKDCHTTRHFHPENMPVKCIPTDPALLYSKGCGLQGYTYFFLFLILNIDYMYSLEPALTSTNNQCFDQTYFFPR